MIKKSSENASFSSEAELVMDQTASLEQKFESIEELINEEMSPKEATREAMNPKIEIEALFQKQKT